MEYNWLCNYIGRIKRKRKILDFLLWYIYILNKKGYNQTIGGEGQNGLIHSKESIEKIRLAELGENNPNTRLTKEQVLKIVDLSKQNKYSQVELSKLYNTSEGTISRILSGLRWSSVTGIKYSKDSSFCCE